MKKSLSEGALRPSDLLAHFKQIQPTTRTQIWAAEVLDNTVELIREMVYAHTMVQPSPHGNLPSAAKSGPDEISPARSISNTCPLFAVALPVESERAAE